MSKFNNIFNKINGSIFGIMAWIVGFLSFTIAIILRIKVDPSFNLSSNYLCDLGVEKFDSHFIFAIGCILNQAFLIPFYISLGFHLQKKLYNSWLIKTAIIASIVSVLSLIFVVPFLVDQDNYFYSIMHGILASTHFGFASLAFTLYGIFELSNPNLSHFYPVLSFITAFMHGFFLLFPFFHLIEWITIAANFSWILVHSDYLLRSDKSQVHNIVLIEIDYLLEHK